MIIYNVTTKVQHSIHQEWLVWMKVKHIPEVMESACFEKFQLVRLLDTDESEGVTYATQYYANNMNAYTLYIENFSEQLRKKTIQAWGDKIIAFRSLMEVVN